MTQITNTYIGNEYGWDWVNQVNWDLLEHNLERAEFVRDNLHNFPRANIEALHTRIAQHREFIQLYKPRLTP